MVEFVQYILSQTPWGYQAKPQLILSTTNLKLDTLVTNENPKNLILLIKEQLNLQNLRLADLHQETPLTDKLFLDLRKEIYSEITKEYKV